MKRLTCLLVLLFAPAARSHAQERLLLQDDWRIRSAARAGADGARISTPAFTATDWYAATVPSTVVGALVENGTYRDPFFGMNLRALPGMSYEIGQNFVHLDMDPKSPFAVPWWYRTSFRLPPSFRDRRVTLHFDGINYRANIWLNGRRLADSSRVVGSYRHYALNVTDAVRSDGPNALAVEVFAPTPADLQTTWVDWNPSPPDKDMGLWQPVWLGASGDVVIRDPHVISRVDTATLDTAELTVGANLRNLSSHAVTGVLRGRADSIAFERTVTLAPHDSAYIRFTPDSFPQLRIAHPRLWWPAEMGEPALHTLDLAFVANDAVSDRQETRFGIREVTAEFTPRGARLFRINGRRILIRGGGWAPDMFFRPQPERQLAQLRYALDMHLNTIRLEGNYEDDRFWQATDSLGLLVMTGWVCCSAWERWKNWKPEQYAVAAASERDQIRRLRGHASALVWLYGSDNPPPADVERSYLEVLRQEHWPNPSVSSASAQPTEVTRESGVKMTGPYDWVPPSYWVQDTTHGGAWGYNTETSPGAAVPPIESMRLMLPPEDVWPLDSVWAFHGAGGQFNGASRFNAALAARYGQPTGAEDYTFKSQLMTYEGERAMFEGYRRNKYGSTGVIQWMLNNAWPSIFWHLFDWYLRPGGGYFGAKIANEPVHPVYGYDDGSIAVVSALHRPVPGARLKVRAFDVRAKERFARDTTLDIPADSSTRVLVLPAMPDSVGTYFLDLRLSGTDGTPLGSSFYWLSTRPDLLDEDSTTWYVTPARRYADYSALHDLPSQPLRASVQFTRDAATQQARVTLTNPGPSLAFFTRLKIASGAGGDEVLPVEWTDNYVSLLPGETRELTATYRTDDLHGAEPVLVLRGWNVPEAEVR